MIVEDERFRAFETDLATLRQRLLLLERPAAEAEHLDALLWADREDVAARLRERRPAQFSAAADLGGQAAPSDGLLTGPMMVHEAHAATPRLPTSFRHLTPGERRKLGLASTEAAIAHDAVTRDCMVTSSRTTYWRDPPAAVLNLVLLCGDGISAPPERELRAAGWRDAGGVMVPEAAP